MVQQTRHWDEGREVTVALRSKEEAFDYRYFSEPDLVPVEPDSSWLQEVAAALGPMPAERRASLFEALGFSARLRASVCGTDATQVRVRPCSVGQVARRARCSRSRRRPEPGVSRISKASSGAAARTANEAAADPEPRSLDPDGVFRACAWNSKASSHRLRRRPSSPRCSPRAAIRRR